MTIHALRKGLAGLAAGLLVSCGGGGGGGGIATPSSVDASAASNAAAANGYAPASTNNVSGIILDVRNNGGGHVNHTLFWETMTPGGATAPSGSLASCSTASRTP